jgi:hypothetical protein
MKEYFVVKENDIEALCTKIKGKRDTKWINFAIWDDKECPEFSASRVLLIWIELTGVRGGFLFPTLNQLGKDECPTVHYQYDAFLEDIKSLCVNVLKKDLHSQSMKNMILGTHVLRKTAFLLAVWGFHGREGFKSNLNPLDEATILNDARHKDISSTMTYLADSGTLKELVNRMAADDITQRVGVYQPIFVKTLDNFASLNSGETNKKDLKELADWYVHSVLKIPEHNFQKWSIHQINNVATEYKPDLSLQEELQELLKREINPASYDHVCCLIRDASDERVKAIMNQVKVVSTERPTVLPISTGLPETSNQPVKDYRQEVNKATNKYDKLVAMVQAIQEIKEQIRKGEKLNQQIKRWAYQAGAIVSCIEKCHAGDISSFVTQNPRHTLKEFKICSQGERHTATLDRSKL